MESLISYKDPLFGVIILAVIIVVVAIINFYTYKIKKYTQDKNIESIVYDFHQSKLKNEYTSLIDSKTISIEFIIQLMEHSYKTGDLKQTINIGISIVKYAHSPQLKQQSMDTLAKAYYKMGFLSRGINLFKESLKIKPDNIQSLKYLVYLFDKTNKLNEAIDTLESLYELGFDIAQYKIYFDIKKILQDSGKSKKVKSKLLQKQLKKYPFTYKMVVEYFIKNNNKILHKLLNKHKNIKYTLNIFYHLSDRIPKLRTSKLNKNLRIIFMLKGWIRAKTIQTSIYQLEVMLDYKLSDRKNNLELSFQNICKNCKYTNVNHCDICPNCLDVFSIQTYPLLNQKAGNNEENKSLQ